MKYVINEKMVVRDEDKALFSLQEMKVYRFNDLGFQILMKIGYDGVDLDKLNDEMCKCLGITKEDLNRFIEKSVQNGVLVQCE